MIITLVLVTALLILTALYAVEDRPQMKRVDASPATYDDGAWLLS